MLDKELQKKNKERNETQDGIDVQDFKKSVISSISKSKSQPKLRPSTSKPTFRAENLTKSNFSKQ